MVLGILIVIFSVCLVVVGVGLVLWVGNLVVVWCFICVCGMFICGLLLVDRCGVVRWVVWVLATRVVVACC